ncbi:MAG: glutathione S-transferase family protein [Alphaproteobacteria bacterium]
MGELIDGVWHVVPAGNGADKSGRFQRRDTQFRSQITRSGGDFPAAAGRYHIYAAHACPWAHRTVMFRTLKGLEDVISVSMVKPLMGDDGWELYEDDPHPVAGARFMRDIYLAADPKYTGRCSVPVLFDKEKHTIVSNESSEIIRMLNDAFADFTDDRTDYYPAALRAEIDPVNDRVYRTLNNGVYRCGFSTTQAAYDEAVAELFNTLDWLEDRLSGQRYLAGDRITEADWRLFATLIRFDWVYHTHFKCNRRKIAEYPALMNYTRELYQVPGIAATVDMPKIKEHYFASHEKVNPTRIVAVGPDLAILDQPHDRDRLPARAA